MKKTRTVILLLLIIPLVSISQNESLPLKKEVRKSISAYFGISSGLSSSKFRDFATSPLIYKGVPKYISLSHIKSSNNRESEIGLSYSFGKYKNSYNNHSNVSDVKTVSVSYSQLFKINKLSTEKLNIKIGGLINSTGNLRTNVALQNNSTGIELFPTLFGSIKITRDISRKENKQKKFLFIKYKLKQRRRNLAFKLNIGLINNSYRNGYVYSGQSSVLNDTKLFDGYQFKVLSGLRMGSALDYSIYLQNKNQIQFSYLWDAYKTGGDLDKFEMAHHTIRVAFLFNTNNK